MKAFPYCKLLQRSVFKKRETNFSNKFRKYNDNEGAARYTLCILLCMVSDDKKTKEVRGQVEGYMYIYVLFGMLLEYTWIQYYHLFFILYYCYYKK